MNWGTKSPPPRLSIQVRVLGSSSLTLTSTQHTPSKTNHDAHLCPLLHWCLQVNRGRVVAPNLVIIEKRSQSTILLLADALSFQMAAFFYTAAMQMKKMRLNNMTTNQPAKMTMAMLVSAEAAVEMVGVGSGRRDWMGRRSQSLRQNDATNPQPNGRLRPVVVPAATVGDHPAAMLNNSGATKTATKANARP